MGWPSGDFGWPWGDNKPTRRQRCIFASVVAVIAAFFVLRAYLTRPVHHSDFFVSWIGARLMLDGVNPYPLVGPPLLLHRLWALMYPGPALVAVIPFSLLPEWIASGVFSGVSGFLLAYGMTRDSWHRTPALASAPFIVAASAAQWSPLFTASWFIPQLAFILVAKPSSGLAAFIYSPTRKHRIYAMSGAVILTMISLVLLPSWPLDWWGKVTSTQLYAIPLLQPGGFLIALVLLRWRQREAWIVLLIALIPQAHSIYDVLVLLVLVPRTYREAMALSVASSVGFLLMVMPENDGAPYWRTLGILRLATCYLPSVVVVLRRPAR